MKKALLIAAVLGLAVLPRVPAPAESDSTNRVANVTEYTIGAYPFHEKGNMDSVREFDGRKFGFIGVEKIDTYGYDGKTQYWFSARDLSLRDEEIELSVGYKNSFGMRFGTSALTHRLARTPAVNPFLAKEGMSGLNGSGMPIGDAFFDYAPNAKFGIERRVNEIGLRVNPGGNQNLALVADGWQQLKHGTRQWLTRLRADAAATAEFPAVTNRTRVGAGLDVDSTTNQGTLGFDARVGKDAVVNYRYESTKFAESAGRTIPGTPSVLPLNAINVPDTKQSSNIVKARARVGKRVYLTGVYSERNRENQTAGVPSGHSDTPGGSATTGKFLGNKVKVDSTNLAATFLATQGLTFTGRYREYKLDNEVPPVYAVSSTTGVAATSEDNQGLSRHAKSWEAEGTYSGLRRTFFRLGYERKTVDRETNPLHPAHPEDEFEHPFTSEETKSDIWRGSVRWYPVSRFSFSGNFENWDTSNPAFYGTPTSRKGLNLNATYMARDNLGLYANWNRVDDKNEDLRQAIDEIPPLPSVSASDEDKEEYTEARERAVGQDYENKATISAVGAWYALTRKLTLDASYGQSKLEASSWWIIGTEPDVPPTPRDNGQRTPHLAPDYVPYEANDCQKAVGLTYAMNRKCRFYTRYFWSNVTGKTLVDVIPNPDAGPTWTPVSVGIDRVTLGFAYDLSPKQRVRVDYSLSKWKDKIDSSQTGDYNVWRLAWSTDF